MLMFQHVRLNVEMVKFIVLIMKHATMLIITQQLGAHQTVKALYQDSIAQEEIHLQQLLVLRFVEMEFEQFNNVMITTQ